MPQVLDDVNYLASEIGPRPAGTEEEQQAALYITEQFQKEAGFTASIEDFKCPANYEIVRLACFGVAFVAALVGFLVNVTVVTAICIVISVIAAVLYVLETKDRPVLSKLLSHGISQNVIAKYEPHAPSSGQGRSVRSRKVILVASYDSGRVEPENKGPIIAALPYLTRASGWALIITPILLLLNTLFFSKSVGVVSLIVSVLIVIGIILLAVRAVRCALHLFQPLNDGANFNASGTAALLEIARRIGNGRMSEAEIAEREAVIHGEEEAREAGLIPEGVEVSYQAEPSENVEDSEESNLAAAKAASAALTGQRVAGQGADISEKLVKVEPQAPASPTEESRREQNAQIKAVFMGTAPEAAVEEPEAMPETAVQPMPAESHIPAPAPISAPTPIVTPAFTKSEPANVPDWYSKAKSRARREKVSTKAHRSRYADALAQAEAVAHESEAFQQLAPQSADYAPNQVQQAPVAQQTQQAPATQQAQQIQQTQQAPVVPVEAPAPVEVPAPVEQRNVAVPVVDQAPAAVQAPVAEQRVPAAADMRGQAAVQRQASNVAAVSDVSRETPKENREPEIRVSRETRIAPNVEQDAVSRETRPQANASTNEDAARQIVESPVAAPVPTAEAGQTVAMAPIDVSDLLQEMSDMKAPEMKEPGFVERFATGNFRIEKEQFVEVEERTVNASPDQTIACAPIDVSDVESSERNSARNSGRKAPIVLPDVPEPEAQPVREMSKQRAPLAEAASETPRKSVREMLSSKIPDLNGNEVPDNRARALQGLSSLPSFSGILGKKDDAEETHEHNTVSATGSFTAVGATGSFAPVGDELVADLDPDDVYVEDADDSDYSENFTETGAFAGPGYMDMPKSRAAKLFDKLPFGKKKKKDDIIQTPQEWLDVDADFDARTVGRERGGWESFQTDEQGSHSAYEEVSYTEEVERTGHFDPVNGEYGEVDDMYEDEVTLPANSPFAQRANRGSSYGNASFAPDEETGYSPRKWNGGAVSVDSEPGEAEGRESSLDDEFRQIYQFRNPDIDTEVWFVALGSQLSGEAGMRAFLHEHASELRGAIVINLEALGDGNLTFMEKEGIAKTCVASSRMKRYVKKASNATGVSCATSQMLWRESAASVAMEHGVQAMTLAGVADGKPAHYCDANDTVGKVNRGTLERNIEFLMAILKNI